jgi:Tfp pilus assembly protein FimT
MSRITIIKNAYGLTVPELVITISIIAILLLAGMPAFSRMMDKQRLTGACNVVYEQLMYARSTSIALNKNVSISFKPAPFDFDQDYDGVKERYNWCIGLNDASVTGCHCSGTAAQLAKCTVAGRSEIIRFAGETNVEIYKKDVTFSGKDKTTFSPRTGTALAGHITLGSRWWGCEVTLSSMGRIRFNRLKDGRFIVPREDIPKLQ